MTTPAELRAAQRLRGQGLRVTRPRLAVMAVLDEAAGRHEHLAVTTVTARASTISGQLSKQVTYDCLEALVAGGLARKIEPAGQPALFESRAGDNHHHLVCRDCGAVTDLDCEVGSAPCILPPLTDGFVVDEAEVVFWGRCLACSRAAAERHSDPTGSDRNAAPSGSTDHPPLHREDAR